MFSAALGLVGSLASAGVGIASANANYQIAMQELKLKREALEEQKDMSLRQYGMGMDQMRREREWEDYIKDMNDRNARAQSEALAFQKGQYDEAKQVAIGERNYALDRQIKADREAAKMQQFQLEEYLKNQSLASHERAYAQNLLEEAKRTAEGEHDDDLRRYYEEREQTLNERRFAIEEMRHAQGIAVNERQQEAALRNLITSRLDGLSTSMEDTQARLGAAPSVPAFTREDIENEIRGRESRAMADVDRAADRVASINEAGLIKAGIDISTPAAARRSEITRRISDEYAKAREGARDSALKYISGAQDTMMSGYDKEMSARSAAYAEQMGVSAAGIEQLLALKPLVSANDYRTPVNVDTGVYNRAIQSSNDYRAPVDLRSVASNDFLRIQDGLGQFLPAPSIKGDYVYNLGSPTFKPQEYNITSPAGFFSNASGLLQSVANGYDPSPYMAAYGEAMQGAGAAFGKGLSALGSFGGGSDVNTSASHPNSNSSGGMSRSIFWDYGNHPMW